MKLTDNIEELEVNARIRNALIRSNFRLISDIYVRKDAVFKVRNLGKKYILELDEVLVSKGFPSIFEKQTELRDKYNKKVLEMNTEKFLKTKITEIESKLELLKSEINELEKEKNSLKIFVEEKYDK